jgi:uncharacterized membrane protein
MVETHVFNTFLVSPLRATVWFGWLNHFNGLIAPAFLFIAGYALGLGMRQAVGARGGWGRKGRRLAGVWLLGYALHFPGPQIFTGQWAEALRLGTPVDVLPCLAVSLALLLLAERYARRWVDALVLAALIVIVFVCREEVANTWRFSPDWLLAYVNRSTGSLFPLLPWMGFVCAGFLASGMFPPWPRRLADDPTSLSQGAAPKPRPLFTTGLAGARAPIAGVVTLGLALSVSGSIGFFFERLCWLLAAVPVVMGLARFWQPRWLLFAGRESLVLYAVHLILIEVLAGVGLPRGGLGIFGCVLTFVGVALASGAIAGGWAWRRKS